MLAVGTRDKTVDFCIGTSQEGMKADKRMMKLQILFRKFYSVYLSDI